MNVPETLSNAFDAAVELSPDSVAIIDARRPGDRGLTFAGLAHEVAKAASVLQDRLHLRRGDVVCSWLPNVPETIVLQLAAAHLGVLTVNLNTRYRGAELAHVLGTTRAAALVLPTTFLGIDFVGIAREVLTGSARESWGASWPDLRAVATLDTSPGGQASDVARSDDLAALDWSSAVAEYGAHHLRPPSAAVPEDLLVGFNTSGTTGLPKLAVHSQGSVVRHASNVARAFDLKRDDRLLAALPLCGAFGFTGAFSALLAGAGLVLQPVFAADQAVRLFRSEHITHAYGPDNLLGQIIDAASDPRELASWRAAAFANFSGDGARVAERIEHVLGIPVRGVYGASELLALVGLWPSNAALDDRHQNGGQPVSGDIEVRVVSPVDGTPLGHGQEGELQVRGYPVMSGYFGSEAASRKCFTDDGWFRTGDRGKTRPDGAFIYLSRLGDSLRLGGFLVDPAEIESILVTHPQVHAAAVVGVAAPGTGDVAVAFIESHATAEDIFAWLKGRVAGFKTPTHIVVVDTLPRVDGPNGVKVKRADLRDRAREIVAAP